MASDIGKHGKYLPNKKIASQHYLENISDWTGSMKMALNEEKCKYMVFNYTRKYQFSTRLFLNQKKLDELDECRLLGVILTNDLSFEKNSEQIVKNAYCRMIMLRKLSEFCVPIEDMLNIYILYIRSAAEQSFVVWHSSLTEEEHTDLERIQKVAPRIILQDL